MNLLFLAEYNRGSNNLLGLIVLIWAVFAFCVPFYVYRIMRRQTENNALLAAILKEIRAERMKQLP